MCHGGMCSPLSLCVRLGPRVCGKELWRPQQGSTSGTCSCLCLVLPGPAWYPAEHGLAWGLRWDALLKLSLPLFSLPPQDPGFASQALINKKLNDYRKVRYGPGAGGHRHPECFIHLDCKVMEQSQRLP